MTGWRVAEMARETGDRVGNGGDGGRYKRVGRTLRGVRNGRDDRNGRDGKNGRGVRTGGVSSPPWWCSGNAL